MKIIRNANDLVGFVGFCVTIYVLIAWNPTCTAKGADVAAPTWPWVTLREQDTGSVPVTGRGPLGTDSMGWAVPIARDGEDTLFVTALHVIADEGEFRPTLVMLPTDGDWHKPAWHKATVERHSSECDLALLRVRTVYRVRELVDVPAMRHIVQREQRLTVPGTREGDSGSGVLTDEGKLFGIIIRIQAHNGKIVEGEAVVASAAMIKELLTAKAAAK